MPRNQTALDFLAGRRSVPPKLLSAPAPGRAEVEALLTIAARSPDHGMLVPWRFVVLEAPALRRIGSEIGRIAGILGRDPAAAAKGAALYATSPLAVVVVHTPRPPDRIPAVEQLLSSGAVCLSLLNAALAAGWGAGWVTGWTAHDPAFLPAILGLGETERVAGIVHMGTGPAQPERPRPDLPAITTWVAT